MHGLTALERELLSCVERLTEASKESAQELTTYGEETRTELAGLRSSVIALLRSQLSLAAALSAWMPDSAQLNDSMEQAQRAKKHLETR